MKTLPTVLRYHHAIVAAFVIALPVAFGLQVGWAGWSAVLGWAIATGWTVSATIEVMALAAARWRKNTEVSRSTTTTSLIVMTWVLGISVFSSVVIVDNLWWWYDRDASPVLLSMFGGGYQSAALTAATLLIHWAGLLAASLTIRRLWRREVPGSAGRTMAIVLTMSGFLWAVIMTGAGEEILRELQRPQMTMGIISSRFMVFQSSMFALGAVLFFVFVRSGSGWARRVTGLQAAWICLGSVGVCLIPFFIGWLMYGGTIAHGRIMTPWYYVTCAVAPILMWGAARLHRPWLPDPLAGDPA